MIHIVTADNRRAFHHTLTQMHRQRKILFIDHMKWGLEDCAGLEIDQFDGPEAIYLIETDPATGAVLQSARLLPSLGAHLLADVFPILCDAGAPRGAAIYEASRFCPAPDAPKGAARRLLLSKMIGAIMETGILFGIEQVSFVASAALAPLAATAGWNVSPLGSATRIGRERLRAMIADVNSEGLTQVRARHGLASPLTRYAGAAFARAA